MNFYTLLECCRPLMFGKTDLNKPIREHIQKQSEELGLLEYACKETDSLEEYLLNHDKSYMPSIVEANLNNLLNGFVDIRLIEDADLIIEQAYIIAIHGVFKIVEKYKIELSRDFMNVWKDNGYFQFFTTGLNLEKQASAFILPVELNNDEFKEIIKKGIEAKIIEDSTNGIKWNRTKFLLAYFAECISKRFGLSKGIDNKGNIMVSWKPFEALFGVKDLKVAKQNWMKLNTLFKPTNHEEIDKLFE